MNSLTLDRELYTHITNWMQSKYSQTTIFERKIYLKKMFKKYKVLNQETLRLLMRTIKYQHQRACLVMINHYCYDNTIDFNIIIPSIKRSSKTIPDILSPEEIKLMIKSAPKPYDLSIRCLFNMGAGLRISELIKFQWDDISWVDWLGKREEYGIVKIKAGKGSKDRIVNIPKNLMKDLYDYAIECKVLNEFKIPTGSMIFKFGLEDLEEQWENDLLLINKEEWKRKYVRSRYNWFRYNILELCCEKALNKRIKIHSIRHSKATYLYEIEKVPIEKIQILLGHTSINTTMIYTKINPRGIFELVKNTEEI